MRSAITKGVVVARLCCETKLWLAETPLSFVEEFLEAFAELVEPVRQHLRFYQSLDMADAKPVAARTFSMPRGWLARGRRDVGRSLFVRASSGKHDAPERGVHFCYYPDEALYSDSTTPFLRQIDLPTTLDERPAHLLQRTLALCERLPILCGHVGYSIETTPLAGNQLRHEGHRAAHELSMRHSGATIANTGDTWRLRGGTAIEGVSWLTLVGRRPLEALGGAAAVEDALAPAEGVVVHRVASGIVVQAGPRPALGDVARGDDLPAYRAVYAALRPAIEADPDKRYGLVMSTADDAALDRAWMARLAGASGSSSGAAE